MLHFHNFDMAAITDGDVDFGSKDFKFAFEILVYVYCIVFAPIYTISASILYYTKVNKAILSNKWIGILYCIFPFICYKLIDIFCHYAGIELCFDIDYSIPVVFILQNVVIVIRWLVRR